MSATSITQLIRCPSCGVTNRVGLNPQSPNLEPVCGRCKTPLPAFSPPVTVTDTSFASVVEGSPLPVLLDLWAPWCGPCRMIAPVIDQLAAELSGRALVAKLNVDENPITSSRFGVQSIPTLIIMKNGREVGRLLGVQPKAEILRRLQPLM